MQGFGSTWLGRHWGLQGDGLPAPELVSGVSLNHQVEEPSSDLQPTTYSGHYEFPPWPESTEGGGWVSVLKRQEGAPLNLG